jgi:4-hydroxy-2-oxovalerate aldolase
MKEAKILDCTLRDGSYSIDFQFTAKDTWLLSSALEQAGVGYIEIGHGLGLNASKKGHGIALETDEAYCASVSGKLTQAKWGTFFIPGIGTLDDLNMLASYGADFVRIGTDVNRIASAEQYIAYAKKLGLMVFSNFMKSYSVSAEKFAEYASQAEEMGSDVLVLVDSAGGMLPEDVSRYTSVLREKTKLQLGFHGHNNLDLAIANSMSALEAGATFIDTSLKGLGRSAGNTITEIFALILMKKGYPCDLNVNALMDIAEKFVKPLIREDKFNSLSMTSGYAQFHSSFMELVLGYSEKYKVDPRELIVSLCRESQTHAPEELVNTLAKNLAQEKSQIATFKISLNDHYIDQTEDILKNAASLATKKTKKLVYNIVHSNRNIPLSPNVQEEASYVLLNGQGQDFSVFQSVIESLRNLDNIIYLVDQPFEKEASVLDNVIIYNDLDLWADSLLEDLNEMFRKKTLYFCGQHVVREYLENKSKLFQFTTTANAELASVVVSFERTAFQTLTAHASASAFEHYYDATIGTILLDQLPGEEPLVYRVDMAPTVFSYIKRKEAYRNLSRRRGRMSGEQFNLISGGILGRRGEIVVDNYRNPTVILGMANGQGGLEQNMMEYQEILDMAQSYITGLGL